MVTFTLPEPNTWIRLEISSTPVICRRLLLCSLIPVSSPRSPPKLNLIFCFLGRPIKLTDPSLTNAGLLASERSSNLENLRRASKFEEDRWGNRQFRYDRFAGPFVLLIVLFP